MIVKLHLESEEHDAVQRYAESLGVTDEDIAYAALNRLMLSLKTEQEAVDKDIVETREWRRHNLPMWSDSARSVHLYESKGDAYSAPSHWLR